jgi:hypothetical protein
VTKFILSLFLFFSVLYTFLLLAIVFPRDSLLLHQSPLAGPGYFVKSNYRVDRDLFEVPLYKFDLFYF